MDAQGALDSLLGRLTTVLVNEAQLLGGVRSDVEFIKDEMESMNGLILHLTEAQHRDHQVRAWMKQVVGLTRDCEGNVELYIHYIGSKPCDDGGLLGRLRRVVRFLRTIPVRHRLATRIQELKVRARDVGDRRQRYGVTVPASAMANIDMICGNVEPGREEEDLRRRAVVLNVAEPQEDDEEVVNTGIHTLNMCLSNPATTRDGAPQPQVKVVSIFGYELAVKVGRIVYQQHSSIATLFSCKAWSDEGYNVQTKLAHILKQIGGAQLQQPDQNDELTSQAGTDQDMEERVLRLTNKIQGLLNGKRFLVVVNIFYLGLKRILDALLQAADGCLPGSVIIMITSYYDLALSSSPYKIINALSLQRFYYEKANELNAYEVFDREFAKTITKISAFARKMLLHLLYVKPTMTAPEKDMCRNAISKSMSMYKSVDHTMVMLCYHELPSKFRSCLLYITIFPGGQVIKSTRLARRWIAEGLVTTSDEIESQVQTAGHYWNVLFIRGFISPVEISGAGNIKSFTLKDEVHKVIAKIAREVNIVDTDLPITTGKPDFADCPVVLPTAKATAGGTDPLCRLPKFRQAAKAWQSAKTGLCRLPD